MGENAAVTGDIGMKTITETRHQDYVQGRVGVLTSALIAAVLAACAPTDYPKQKVGTLAGAAAGAYAGQLFGSGTGRLAATAGGTLLGALVGGGIGRSLDRADILYAQRAQHQALEYAPSGSTVGWVNPATGHAGTVTPLRTYQYGWNRYCREYRTRVSIGGWTGRMHGTACRQVNGSWVLR